MRALILIALTAACTSKSEAESALDSLEGQVQVACGTMIDQCVARTPAAQVMACMNDALQTGKLGEANWSDYDSKGYYVYHYLFADGGRVRTFERDPDDFGGDATYVTEKPSCAGPFHIAMTDTCSMDVIDGCP